LREEISSLFFNIKGDENMDILTQVKLITGKTDEALINLLIDKTKQEVALICKRDYINEMDNVASDIVCWKLNTKNTEGLTGQSYNGVSESYLDNYPISIRKQLYAFMKRVHFL